MILRLKAKLILVSRGCLAERVVERIRDDTVIMRCGDRCSQGRLAYTARHGAFGNRNGERDATVPVK